MILKLKLIKKSKNNKTNNQNNKLNISSFSITIQKLITNMAIFMKRLYKTNFRMVANLKAQLRRISITDF